MDCWPLAVLESQNLPGSICYAKGFVATRKPFVVVLKRLLLHYTISNANVSRLTHSKATSNKLADELCFARVQIQVCTMVAFEVNQTSEPK